MFSLEGKVAVVTGGATGFGYAIAELFATAGATVILVSRNARRGGQAADTVASRAGYAKFIAADVSREIPVREMVEKVVEHTGRIDILVNNAGVMKRALITDMEESDWDYTLGVNLKGAYLCAKHVIPIMLRNEGGVIINIASYLGLRSGSGTAPAYSAAKGGLVTLTKALAVQYGPHNIRVNCICPAWILTELYRDEINQTPDTRARIKELEEHYRAMYPLKKLGAPQDVAYAALFLAADESRWISGVSLLVDGGLSAK